MIASRQFFQAVLTAVMMLVLGAAGCSDAPTSGPSPAAKPTRKAPPAPKPPEPVADVGGEEATEAEDDEEPALTYVVEGRRDPFRSFQFTSTQEPEVEAGPLADFDLSQLSVVGVVWNTRNPRALVSDPGGRSFVLSQGSPIGKNNGRVVRIDDDMILVREKFIDFEGAVSTKDVEMRIRKVQGG